MLRSGHENDAAAQLPIGSAAAIKYSIIFGWIRSYANLRSVAVT